MQNQTIERTTLTNLLNNEEYTRKVLPFIKPEYFKICEKYTKIIEDWAEQATKNKVEVEVAALVLPQCH